MLNVVVVDLDVVQVDDVFALVVNDVVVDFVVAHVVVKVVVMSVSFVVP